ncbi:hypothetical protein Tco_1313852 [Tanacetum coccineum]
MKGLHCRYSVHNSDVDVDNSMWIISRVFLILASSPTTVSEVKRAMLHLDFKICAKDKNFSSILTYTTMMLPRVRNHHGGKCYSAYMRRIVAEFSHVPQNEYSPRPNDNYIKVSESAQDRDVGLGEADLETSPEKESMKKAFQDMLHELGGYQENSKDIFSLGSALEDFICVVFIPDRNIIWILQKSQENGQSRTITDTGKERVHKSRENAIKVRTKEAQEGQITDSHAGNPCAHQNNPRAKNRDSMIGIYSRAEIKSRGAGQET